jgi:hypothetical protein
MAEFLCKSREGLGATGLKSALIAFDRKNLQKKATADIQVRVRKSKKYESEALSR